MIHYLVWIFLTSLCFGGVVEAPALSIDFVQNPSDIDWKKIDTSHFEIIFPKQVEAQAQRVAFLLESAYPFVTRSLESAPPKISLILQNQSSISNGFVTLAPRRSEWYMTPSLDPELNNTEWLKTLAVHEFRHVVQFQKTRQGVNFYLEKLLGEIGQAVGIGLTLPPWYLEGDAVGIETALTNGGRGRLPLFERDLRTILLSGKAYDYDKSHLGSYEDYLPNHYVFGYFFTTYMRNNFGDLFLSQIAEEASKKSYNPLTFYNAYHRLTGKSFESFYTDTMKSMVEIWNAKFKALNPTPYEIKNLGKRFGWTNYLYPQPTDDGKILALKRGLSFIDQFVLVDGKNEKRVVYPGPLVNEYPYKLRNGKFAWVEYELDPRWGNRDFAQVKVYDLNRDKVVLRLKHTKWRLATVDHRGKFLLAVDWNTKQEQSIVVVDLKGKGFFKILYPYDKVITSLDWLNNDEIVMVVKDQNDFKKLVQFNLKTGNESVLVKETLTNLGFVSVSEGKVLLESPESGIDNIYLISPLEDPQQLTSSAFGSYAPTLKKDQLIYNDYSVNGMNVVKKTLPWDEEQKSADSFFPFYEKFAQKENKHLLQKSWDKPKKYEVKDYSQFKNALNLHSWVILAPPLGTTITLQGISRDVLNKFSLVGGAEYNLNEKETQAFVSASWSHYYPVFDLRASYGKRRQDLIRFGNKIENQWEEGVSEGGIQIPWRMIYGRFIQEFTVRGFSKIIKVNNKLSGDVAEVNDGALFSPGGDVDYSITSRLSRRDIFPEWGARFRFHLEEGRDITGDSQRGSLLSLDSRYYIPGIWHHHSFWQEVAYERQRDRFYQYSSLVYYPRGTKSVFLSEFRKYSGNYTLPILYPDWHWSRYVYLKRVNLNLFYDHLIGRDNGLNYEAASYGWETTFETYFFRLAYPLSWGVRGNYILKGEEKDNYELFLSSVVGYF